MAEAVAVKIEPGLSTADASSVLQALSTLIREQRAVPRALALPPAGSFLSEAAPLSGTWLRRFQAYCADSIGAQQSPWLADGRTGVSAEQDICAWAKPVHSLNYLLPRALVAIRLDNSAYSSTLSLAAIARNAEACTQFVRLLSAMRRDIEFWSRHHYPSASKYQTNWADAAAAVQRLRALQPVDMVACSESPAPWGVHQIAAISPEPLAPVSWDQIKPLLLSAVGASDAVALLASNAAITDTVGEVLAQASHSRNLPIAACIPLLCTTNAMTMLFVEACAAKYFMNGAKRSNTATPPAVVAVIANTWAANCKRIALSLG